MTEMRTAAGLIDESTLFDEPIILVPCPNDPAHVRVRVYRPHAGNPGRWGVCPSCGCCAPRGDYVARTVALAQGVLDSLLTPGPEIAS